MTAPPLHPVDVFLLLLDGDRILLGLRRNTGFADGQWNLPSGKLEAGEDVVSAVIREAREEVGVRVRAGDVRLAATVHYRGSRTHARIGLVFAAEYEPARHGEPVNAEPDKCARLDWFPAAALPAETTSFSAICVRAFLGGKPLLVVGWPDSGRG